MSKGRIALFAAGLVIAVGALFLLVRGFSGTAPREATVATADKAAGAADRGKAKAEAPPGWQSFIRPAERDAPPRPVVRLAQRPPDPFDRPSDRLPAAKSGARRQESPELRLEGISAGARAVALVSGRTVRVGDTVSGFRVERIGRRAVTLAGPRGARLELDLREEREDRPADGGGR